MSILAFIATLALILAPVFWAVVVELHDEWYLRWNGRSYRRQVSQPSIRELEEAAGLRDPEPQQDPTDWFIQDLDARLREASRHQV